MSDSAEGRDWLGMKPSEFGVPIKASQDGLFLVDDDPCGTEALDGLGFGAVLGAEEPDTPPAR
ncbi:hypothetical protein [Actinacidiphila soli]|uniref:hypothetical protein n=1 Tax=Actinacidiphila soli TaxID=2487275 RepID=UPI000FCA45A4|nr:hypothetical protein [Actinacidiphila soli]